MKQKKSHSGHAWLTIVDPQLHVKDAKLGRQREKVPCDELFEVTSPHHVIYCTPLL